MSSKKYIGLDVHQATISVAVMDSQGKGVMESILETKASTILEFLAGLRGTLSLTFEEEPGQHGSPIGYALMTSSRSTTARPAYAFCDVVPNGEHGDNLALPDFASIALSNSLLLRVQCR